MPPRLILYERQGCHLCEDVRMVLDAEVGPDRYARVDVDASDEFVLRYGFRVPVIAVDGVDQLEAPMTEADVRSLVARLAR